MWSWSWCCSSGRWGAVDIAPGFVEEKCGCLLQTLYGLWTYHHCATWDTPHRTQNLSASLIGKYPHLSTKRYGRPYPQMEDAGVIRPSKSPYASPIVVVSKKMVPWGSAWTTETEFLQYQRCFSSTKNRGSNGGIGTGKVLLDSRSYIWLLAGWSGWTWQAQNCIQHTDGVIWGQQDAVWPAECPINLPKIDDLLFWWFEFWEPPDLPRRYNYLL